MATVSIWVADGNAANVLMQAYNAANTLASSATVVSSRTWHQMTVTGSGISSVTLRGSRIGGYDDLSFGAGGTAVPEPGALALVGLGLLGVAFSRGRRA